MLEKNFENIVIATTNNGKVKEFSYLLKKYNINDITSLSYYNDIDAPVEDGLTFEDNAKIKALYYGNILNEIVISDDSGLVVPDIDGNPGIYSARWAGKNKDFNSAGIRIRDLLIQKFLIEEEEINHYAYFECVVSIFNPFNKKILVSKGIIEGQLSFPPLGDNGFGYDKIFIPKGYNRSFANLSIEEKNNISHRKIALNKLMQNINNIW